MELQRAEQEQQREQQKMPLVLVEQQKELMQHRKEMAEQDVHEERKANKGNCLPKLTLQKLGLDDIEHCPATIEKIVKWPAEIWAKQLPGLLTRQLMLA